MPDQRDIERACADMMKQVDRVKMGMKEVHNRHEGLGASFRNDRRFTSDAIKLRDAIRDHDRALRKVEDQIRSIRNRNR